MQVGAVSINLLDDDAGAEHFQISIESAGHELRLAADSAQECAEWVEELGGAHGLPPAPPPVAGTRDKKLTQLAAERQQTRLVRQMSLERRDDRTLSVHDEQQYARSVELLMQAQECGRDWGSFSTADIALMVRGRGRIEPKAARPRCVH
eukprot:4506224-Prymnesium_polylepis.1